jgi:hypothetical protein
MEDFGDFRDLDVIGNGEWERGNTNLADVFVSNVS